MGRGTRNEPRTNDLRPRRSAIAEAINKRYKNFDKSLVTKVEVGGEELDDLFLHRWGRGNYSKLRPILQYDPEARLILVDVEKAKGDRNHDLTQMAYYMEKDVRPRPPNAPANCRRPVA